MEIGNNPRGFPVMGFGRVPRCHLLESFADETAVLLQLLWEIKS